MEATKKCTRCKITLDQSAFYYNGKDHTYCFSCSQRRTVANNVCQTCGIRAYYNMPNETIGIACSKHRTIDMINIKSPKCIICQTKQPYFNYVGESKALYCKECSEPCMIDVKNPKCITCQTKHPAFNYVGESKALYCKECSEPCMIDVKHPKCIICQTKHPNFNYVGESKALYCKECSEPCMINIKSPKCIICQTKQPVFNYVGESKALYCKECSEPCMIDVKNPKCIICQTKRPIFNYVGESKALYCKDCSEPGMINIKNPKCITCQTKQPNFNYVGESKALYCKDCSEPDMVNVKSRKCEICNKCVSYGVPCNRPNRCTLHKLEGMIKNPTSRCRKKSCNNMAEYGVRTPIHCQIHKTDNDVFLVERICTKCGRLDVLIDGICVNFCSMNDKASNIKKYQKTKEKRVLKILTSSYKAPTEYNFRIPYECGGRNSEEKEIGYDFGTFKVFVEVDENQHKSYCEKGEFNRMRNIYMSEGGINIMFIRYNPDNFVGDDRKKQVLSQAKREELLIKWLEHYEEHGVSSPLSVNYLFYDGWKSGINDVYDIDPYNDVEHECPYCGSMFYVDSMYERHLESH